MIVHFQHSLDLLECVWNPLLYNGYPVSDFAITYSVLTVIIAAAKLI